MSVSGLPFDDIRALLKNLPQEDTDASALAIAQNKALSNVFGKFEHQATLMAWLAGWSGKSPIISRPLVALFAGSHKTESALDKDGSAAHHGELETTLQSVTRLAAGGSPVNQVCAEHDIGLKVFDLALQYPVEDIREDEALDEKASAATIGFGMESIAGGIDLLGLSGFGKGARVSSAAILAILLDKNVEDFLEAGDAQAIAFAKEAVEAHKSAKDNPLELLRRLGGREHSALAGGIIAARTNHIPVVFCGHVAWSVMAVLNRENAQSCLHCVSASYDDLLNDALSIAHVLNDDTQINDGSACAQAIAYLKSSAAVHTNTVLNLD
ncbi:MAG: nicotinate-nucleotide--dimethylbenzimidazole phosphoribosyltransferase [Nitratireductor sp.]